MSGSDTYHYLVKQYIKMGLISDEEKKENGKPVEEQRRISGNKPPQAATRGASLWDPFIYPDSGYIPPCSVCKSMYDEYAAAPTKPDRVVWSHHLCGCLWSEFYQDKILKVNESVVFVKSK